MIISIVLVEHLARTRMYLGHLGVIHRVMTTY